MRIKKFKKELLQAKCYPYKSIKECPRDKQSDFLWYIARKARRGTMTPEEAEIFFKAIGKLPED